MKPRSLLGMGAVLLFLDVVWVAATYLIYPGYLDHGEPSVTLLSWRLLEGFPVFLDFDDSALISNVYGPMTYVVHAVSFWLFEPSIIAGKTASFVAATLIPIFVFLSQRHRGNSQAAIGAILACGLVLFHVPFSIWNRPDSFMALLVVIAVWAANASDPGRSEWSKSVIIALAAGLAVGMKLHAGAYFAPVVLFHCASENRGFKTFVAMAAIGLAMVLLPFAFSVFSFSAFVDWIVLHAHKDSSSVFGSKFVRYGFLYFTPVLFYLAALRWSGNSHSLAEKVYFGVFVVSLVAILFPATKVGAGTHYFYPFLVIIIDQVLRQAGRVEVHKAWIWGLVGGLAMAVLIVGIPVQKRFYRALHWKDIEEIQSEIRTIMKENQGRTIEIGFGKNLATYPRTLSRTLLVFAGHPYSIDSAPAMETNKWNIPLPEETLSMLRHCKTDLWLIPVGEQPFTMIGYYGELALAPVFADAFNAGYGRVKSYKYFDIWACKK